MMTKPFQVTVGHLVRVRTTDSIPPRPEGHQVGSPDGLELRSRKGCHHTRMQNLADALGMQKGSLYYDIEGKRDLLGILNWTQEWFSPRHRYTALEPAGTPANSVPRAL